jgi:integrase
MSRDAVERRLAKHTAAAAPGQPSLKGKKVSPHVLRHTAAMRLEGRGVASAPGRSRGVPRVPVIMPAVVLPAITTDTALDDGIGITTVPV